MPSMPAASNGGEDPRTQIGAVGDEAAASMTGTVTAGSRSSPPCARRARRPGSRRRNVADERAVRLVRHTGSRPPRCPRRGPSLPRNHEGRWPLSAPTVVPMNSNTGAAVRLTTSPGRRAPTWMRGLSTAWPAPTARAAARWPPRPGGRLASRRAGTRRDADRGLPGSPMTGTPRIRPAGWAGRVGWVSPAAPDAGFAEGVHGVRRSRPGAEGPRSLREISSTSPAVPRGGLFPARQGRRPRSRRTPAPPPASVTRAASADAVASRTWPGFRSRPCPAAPPRRRWWRRSSPPASCARSLTSRPPRRRHAQVLGRSGHPAR